MSSKRVDERHLESGMVRLRFRLSHQAHKIVTLALSLTPYSHSGAALDAIALNSLSGSPASQGLGIPAAGSKRLLVRLFADQYQCVRSALDVARDTAATDADALLTICARFIVEHNEE